MSLDVGPVWMIGCGNMGGAMLRRWVAAGVSPASVTVVTRTPADVPAGVRALQALPMDEEPAVVVLAVKPQQLGAVAPMLAHLAPPLLVSILAGVEAATLRARIPAAAVVRAMPNLPVAIGKGVTALYAADAGPEARAVADTLAAALGAVEWVEREDRFDAVTALAGCGPAFLFRFVEALAGAGAALGLPADQAQRLALATVEGAAAMAAGADAAPGVLADRVASPGGSTRQGLNILDADRALAGLLERTLAAAARRTAEMAAAARGASRPA